MLLPRSRLPQLLLLLVVAVLPGAKAEAAAAVEAVLTADFDAIPELRILPESWAPRETVRPPVDNVGVSPRPTMPPQHHYPGVAGALFGGFDLFKRATGFTMSTDTCGYVASSWDNAYTCGRVGATCSNDGKYIGCCSSGACTAIKTTCLPYSSSLAGACNSTTGLGVLCCSTSTRDQCYVYTFSTTASPGRILTMVACDSKTGTGLLLDYPPSYTRSTTSTSGKSTAKTTTTTKTPTSPSGDDNDVDGSSTTTRPAVGGGSQTSGASSAQGGSSTNVGAIAGGVVGGVAVIAIAAIGILFMVRRSKRPDNGKVSPSTASPPVAQTFPPSGTAFVAPGYASGPPPGAPSPYGVYPAGGPPPPGTYPPAPGTGAPVMAVYRPSNSPQPAPAAAAVPAGYPSPQHSPYGSHPTSMYDAYGAPASHQSSPVPQSGSPAPAQYHEASAYSATSPQYAAYQPPQVPPSMQSYGYQQHGTPPPVQQPPPQRYQLG